MKTELLPIIDCAGSPRQRGRAHGEALRAVIVEKTARWRDAIGEAYGIPAETFLHVFWRRPTSALRSSDTRRILPKRWPA
jgi:hypothetical protein